MQPFWRSPDVALEPNPWTRDDRPFDEREREESRPPATETVEWHLTFAAEAYLPSHSAELVSKLRTLGWSPRGPSQRGQDLVIGMRQATLGGGWAALTTLVPEPPTFLGALQNRKVETLPSGVSSIQLWLWSATPSLTILIAGVEWDEDRGDALDRIAKKDYPSIAVPSGTGHSIYSPFFHKRLEAERCRKRAHEDVESWLRERVPGAFTDLGAPMPTLDVITSARYRPFADEPAHYHDYREALSLGRRFRVGKSQSLPVWTLDLGEGGEPTNVLTLGARTVEAVESVEYRNGRVEETRWQLLQTFGSELMGLLSGWTVLSLMEAFSAVLLADSRPRTRQR
ncbi:MAG: hypothetical protein WBQ21_05095 [Solirubrobacteraceae bacterium]